GGAIGWLKWKPEPGVPSSGFSANVSEAARPAVAVLGFRNLSGREDAQWLSLAIAEMVTTELAATEALRTIPGENINRMRMELALGDADSFGAEMLTRIKGNLSANFLVSGSYVLVGEGAGTTLRLDVRLQNAGDGRMVA